MMKYSFYILLGLLISCSPKISTDQNKNATEVAETLEYQSKAYEALGVTPVKFEMNATGQYVLATYLDETAIPGTTALRAVVINVETNEIVLKKILNNGSVNWKSDFILEIVAPPGMPKDDQENLDDYTYAFDVKAGERVKSLNIKITD